MTGTVTLGDVRDAARLLEGAIVRTPATISATLGEVLGCTVVVKFENLQFTASFKERGARNMLERLTPAERSAGVVAVSAGNHAQAVARHARLLGIPATIVMPEPTPFVKVSRTRLLGATVELHGETLVEAMTRGEQLVGEQGRTFVHPFDDPHVVAGAGTAALELLADHPDLDVLLVPVGGGGLLAGMSVVARELCPHVELVGVQTEAYPSMLRALAGDTTPVDGGATLAEGIAVKTVGAQTLPVVKALVSDIVLVGEDLIERAVNACATLQHTLAEGAGAASVAALIDHPDQFRGRHVGVVVTGGNVDPRTLASVIMRGLVRTGRLNRWRVLVDDRPGALAKLTAVVGAVGGNIIEVGHQRLLASVPVRFTEVELAVETMDPEHGERVLAAMREAGYRVGVVPLDAAL